MISCLQEQFHSRSGIFIIMLICVVCVHAQSCLTFCNPVDYSLPGSSVLEIFQARVLE